MYGTIRKAFLLLPPRSRRRWAALIPLAVLGAGAEAIGAGLVFGLVTIIGNPAQAGFFQFQFSNKQRAEVYGLQFAGDGPYQQVARDHAQLGDIELLPPVFKKL